MIGQGVEGVVRGVLSLGAMEGVVALCFSNWYSLICLLMARKQ